MQKSELTIILPTYNEAENIEALCKDILKYTPLATIIIVDDNSPDKTYEIGYKLNKEFPNIITLRRFQKRGRGYAGIDGFKKALSLTTKYILEMDADFSHNPIYLSNFLEKVPQADVVIGSRYVSSGLDNERNSIRKLISFLAKLYLKIILKIEVKDPTSGYRLFKVETIKNILPLLKAGDPFIVTEILYYCNKLNYKIVEIPIVFEDRKKGVSKLKFSTLFNYLLQVMKLRLKNPVEGIN